MHGDKIDLKNSELGKELYWLRQYIDIHRLVILNADFLQQKESGGQYWTTTYRMSFDAIAVGICKIFERQTMGYERNSIPGIVDEFETAQLDAQQQAIVRRYGEKYKIANTGAQPAGTFCRVTAAFKDQHSHSFQRLKTYRDKFASHTEHGFKLEDDLPSHDEFEAIYEFAHGFYFVVHELSNVTGAMMEKRAEIGLDRVIKKLGLENPLRQFLA
jgi:hypothetical protein